MDIQPGILAHSEQEFREKVERVRGLGRTLHIDVMDGTFVKNTTWAAPESLHEILDGLHYEVHLMVANPEHAVPIWIAAGADRIIYHRESTDRDQLIFNSVGKDCCKQLGIAINPDTPVSAIAPLLSRLEMVLVMGVAPGWSGQAMQEIVFDKVRELKRIKPGLLVGMDGGFRAENALALKDAGADMVVATSAVTEATDPAAALRQLLETLQS